MSADQAGSDEPTRPLAATYAVAFLCATLLPIVRMGCGATSDGAARELRRAERAPKLTAKPASWLSYPERFEDWYANEFGFRDELVREHNRIKWLRLRSSPVEKVICGEKGWVFYNARRALDQLRGAAPFEPEQLAAWVELLTERRDWLEERNAHYLFAIAPSKGSIYPEFLPAGYETVGNARFDQLEAAAREAGIEFLDLRASLRDEKRNDRGGDYTYFPLGTHWTQRGALRAWREIVRAVPEVFAHGPAPLEELRRVLHTDEQGDSWGTRLYLEEELRQEVWTLSLGPAPTSTDLEYSRQGMRFHTILTDASGRPPKVMMFHDSFGSTLRSLLARSCSELTSFWRYAWELATIESEAPDLVIDLFVERALVTASPEKLRLRPQEELRALFDAAGPSLWRMPGGPDSARWLPVDGLEQYSAVDLGVLPGEGLEALLVRAEVEHEMGGVLELAFGSRTKASLRRRTQRALAGPGRSLVYFNLEASLAPSQAILGSEQDGWQVHSIEARRAEAP